MPELDVWVVDPLRKVLPTDRRDRRPPRAVVIEAARNEVESGQVAVRSAGGTSVHAVVSPLVHADGDARIDQVRVNPVEWVHLEAPPAGRAVERRGPLVLPDVLGDSPEFHVEAGETRAVWLTVEVPPGARPGAYRGQVTLSGARETAAVPVELTVYWADVPAQRTFRLAQWFSADGALARHIPGAVYPREAFWGVIREVARNMRAHRQNVVRLPFGPTIAGPIAASPTGIDGLAFDFTGFDRLVEMFSQEGAADLVAGAPLAGRPRPGAAGLTVRALLNVGGCLAAVDLKSESPECRHFLRYYLTALHRHLQLKGWVDRYVQHICDDPTETDLPLYRGLVEEVRQRLPGVRLIETCTSTKVGDQVDVRVPRLDHFLDCLRPYHDRQRAGAEVWFCTSADTADRYPGHSFEHSLLDVRLLSWMNAAFKATGYLHGGYNDWDVADPRRPPATGRPTGGGWIVYPGRNRVLDSLRHEALRDGVEDYELLRLLERDHPRQAIALVRSVVKSPRQRTRSVATFRAARRRLLELLSG